MWLELKLKIDEASYFCGQLRAHTRQPRLFLFYLSAFLTSARCVTFYLQKRFTHHDPGGVYQSLKDDWLSDHRSKFFVECRNRAEKEGYPRLTVTQQVGRKTSNSDELTWWILGKWELFGNEDEIAESESAWEFFENCLRSEWELTSLGGPPSKIEYRWTFADFPEGPKDVVIAGEEFIACLWNVLTQFRAQWEAEHDPDSWEKKFNRFINLAPPEA